MNLKRVVITGLGAITSLGNTVDAFWDGLLNGVSGAADITRFDASKYKTQFACEIKGYEATNYFERKEARRLDPYAQYAMISADEAVKDAGFDPEAVDLNRVGVITGTGIGGFTTFLYDAAEFGRNEDNPRFNPFFIPKIVR